MGWGGIEDGSGWVARGWWTGRVELRERLRGGAEPRDGKVVYPYPGRGWVIGVPHRNRWVCRHDDVDVFFEMVVGVGWWAGGSVASCGKECTSLV